MAIVLFSGKNLRIFVENYKFTEAKTVNHFTTFSIQSSSLSSHSHFKIYSLSANSIFYSGLHIRWRHSVLSNIHFIFHHDKPTRTFGTNTESQRYRIQQYFEFECRWFYFVVTEGLESAFRCKSLLECECFHSVLDLSLGALVLFRSKILFQRNWPKACERPILSSTATKTPGKCKNGVARKTTTKTQCKLL